MFFDQCRRIFYSLDLIQLLPLKENQRQFEHIRQRQQTGFVRFEINGCKAFQTGLRQVAGCQHLFEQRFYFSGRGVAIASNAGRQAGRPHNQHLRWQIP
jgi:hypothetical protein